MILFLLARKDNEGEGETQVEEQAVDEDDMVELFKLQFHKINEVLDTLPLKFRTIDESVEENFVKWQEKADIKLKQLEGHLNELTVDIEDLKEKNNTDKKFMKSQVELVQKGFEDFKTTYEAKTQIITSLAGATSWIIEATWIKAFLEDSRTEQRENEIVRRSQLKNFTIENSLPSLNGDPTWVTMNTSKVDLSDIKSIHKRNKSVIEDLNKSYQEIYVYRDVPQEIVESVYYRLINYSTEIYNKNIEFKKLGFDLEAVFNRCLKMKKDASSISIKKNKRTSLPPEFKVDDSDYSELNYKGEVNNQIRSDQGI